MTNRQCGGFILCMYIFISYISHSIQLTESPDRSIPSVTNRITNTIQNNLRYALLLRFSDFAGLFSAWSNHTIEVTQEQNHTPVVKILSPGNNTYIEPNALIRYTIDVTDTEDGQSKYQEIAANEVLLEIMYLPDSAKAADYLSGKTQRNEDHPGLSVMRTSDCFNCHAVKDKLQGPPFAEIARRYANNSMAVETLSMRVIKGNSGIWGSAAMPPHPAISQEQAKQIAHWILENAGDDNLNYYAGLEGAFRTKPKSESEVNGMYLLTASYTDHGLTSMPQQKHRGQHTILLKIR